MAHLLADLTNEIAGGSGGAGNYGYDEYSLSDSGRIGPYTMFLGVFVTLIPKIIPRMLPKLVSDKKKLERFDDPNYEHEVEVMFKERFMENLELFEKIVLAWQQNGLPDLGFGPDHPLAKEDLVTGEPESFQTDLLRGIRFLKNRVERIGRRDDKISRVAELCWTVFNVTYEGMRTFMEQVFPKDDANAIHSEA